MHTLSFLDLLSEIFLKKDPNIDKIQKKGLLAVKIAQTFALRIDFLDENKCIQLMQLFNHVDKIPPGGVDVLLKKNAPPDWMEHFQVFDPNCFASASIGQVHRATLKSGETVAVKLIKGDFKAQFSQDVASLLKLFKTLILFYKKLERVADPVGILDNIRSFTLDELDLRNEIQNQEILLKIHEQHKQHVQLDRLKFPKIFKELSHENVMVSEFIEGETFDKKLTEGTLDYEQLLELFHIHGFYMFGIGTFHGDIHPGNLIYKDDDIYFVDCGAIGHVSEKMRKGLFRFMEALSFYDYPVCAQSLNLMSEVALEGNDFVKFQEKFMQLYQDFSNKTVSQVSLTKQMMETIKLGVHSGMRFEKGMFPIIKSLMYLDGMVIKCNPNAVLMKDMRRNIDALKKYL